MCPYPGCGRTLPVSGLSRFCACEHREPLVACAACGVTCPAEARFCRGCRALLPPKPLPDCRKLTETPSPEFLFVPGVFHAPPMIRHRHLWCMSASGQVSRLSLTPGAVPRVWASIGSQAVGCNRSAIVDAAVGQSAVGRPMLVALDPGGIWTLPLTEHQADVLYRPPSGQEIVASTNANQSIYFRGLAVTSEAYAFLQRHPGASEAFLTIRYFAENRAGDPPLRVSGASFLGPVMENGVVAVCGEEEVWAYRIAEQKCQSFEFKRFEPAFARSASAPNVPPGGMPLWAGTGDRGLEARIPGTREGATGWLRVFLDKHYDEFVPLPREACISRAEPYGLCVNELDTIDFVGIDRAPGRYTDLEPGMAVGYARPYLAYFERAPAPGKHELTVVAGIPYGVRFEDKDCHKNSCCGIQFAEESLVLSYFVPSRLKKEPGLKVVYWRLSD